MFAHLKVKPADRCRLHIHEHIKNKLQLDEQISSDMFYFSNYLSLLLCKLCQLHASGPSVEAIETVGFPLTNKFD